MKALHYFAKWTHTSFSKNGPCAMLLQQAYNVTSFTNSNARVSTRPDVTEDKPIESASPYEAINQDTGGIFDRHNPYPLSKEEAFTFLENVLGIKSPQLVYQANPLVTMNTIAGRIRRTIPFTTMDMFDRPLDQINDENGKEHILRCHGGWCTSLNPFTRSLLDHLGYRTQDVLASIPGMSQDTHIATVVWDASHPGSCHLVDPGVRRPFLQAISLDFEKESPIYKFHYARYKFFKEEGDKVLWSIQPSNRIIQKLSKDESITDMSGQKWQVLLRYNLGKPMARYHINKYWQMLIQGNKPVPPGVDGLVFCAFKNDYVVEINATREKIIVKIFDEDSQVESMQITSEELIRFFVTYFPNYPVEMLMNAIKADFSWLPGDLVDKYIIGKQSLAV